MKRSPNRKYYKQKFPRPYNIIYGHDGAWIKSENYESEKNKSKNKKREMTKLYHFSKFQPPSLSTGNFVHADEPTFYHTNEKWRYFDRLAQAAYVLEIPTNELKQVGKNSRFACRNQNDNGYCITWILPPFQGKVNHQNTVRYEFGNARSPNHKNIVRYHVNWVEPKTNTPLLVKNGENNIMGPFKFVGKEYNM